MNLSKRHLSLALTLGVLVMGPARAGERNRAESAAPRDEAKAVSSTDSPAIEVESSDSFIVTTPSGIHYRMYADGRLDYEELEATFGSIQRYKFELEHQGIPYITTSEGTRVYADGSMGVFEDMLGADARQSLAQATEQLTPEQPQPDIASWQQTIDGVTLTLSADGTVINNAGANLAATKPEPWLQHRKEVPYFVDADGVYRYADGAVFEGEPPGVPGGE